MRCRAVANSNCVSGRHPGPVAGHRSEFTVTWYWEPEDAGTVSAAWLICLCICCDDLKYPLSATATITQHKKGLSFMKNVQYEQGSALHFSLAAARSDIIRADIFITCWNFTLLHLLSAASANPVNQRLHTSVVSHHGNGGGWWGGLVDKVMCLSDALLSVVQSAGLDISAGASSCVITPRALFYNIDKVSGLVKHQRCHNAEDQHRNKRESSPISSWGHQGFKSSLWWIYGTSVLHILYSSCQLHQRS